ncbi:hypothetical protein AC249_AIPGENE26432 [Exaiptasia diaphana]|nr:hypothetical protein AC249_AIPGENE26432 [Exaiptasia diaphana]
MPKTSFVKSQRDLTSLTQGFLQWKNLTREPGSIDDPTKSKETGGEMPLFNVQNTFLTNAPSPPSLIHPSPARPSETQAPHNDNKKFIGNAAIEEKPKVKPSTYNGSTPWEDYLAQFELVAEINKWSMTSKATYLANRSRLKDEKLPELAQAIRRLTRQAYPEAPQQLRETLARDYFMDADMRWRIHQSRPKTLNDALTVAVELEAFLETGHPREQVHSGYQ